jgi:hypothetical protein
MRKRDVLKGAALGATAALVAAPAVELLVQDIVGAPHAPEVFAGALLATAFFGVTAVTAAFFQNTPALRTAVMLSYVIKTSLVIIAIELINVSQATGRTFGISLTISGVVYLFFQTTYIARWRHGGFDRIRPN